MLETLASREELEVEITIHETSDTPSGFTDRASTLFNDVDESPFALDITGRPPVYPTLLFQQAVADTVDADHIYHLDYCYPPDTLDDDLYPTTPRTAFTLRDILIDFTEGETDA